MTYITCKLLSSVRERDVSKLMFVRVCTHELLCVCVCPRTQTKMLVPMYLTYLTVLDKVMLIMTIKKPRAILLAAVIVSCDYLLSARNHYIPHNPPRTRVHCHLITLSIIFQSAGKTNSAPVFNKLEAIGVSKKPLI